MTEKTPTKKPVSLKVKTQPKQPISNAVAAQRLYGKTETVKTPTKK